MKILQINATYGIGSTGRITKILHEKLKLLGHESFVVASVVEPGEKNDENIFVPCRKFLKNFSALSARVSGYQSKASVISTKRIIKFIERIQPDVIQLANLHANFVNLSMLLEYIAEKNIPLVVILHDCWFFTGKCTNYIDANCFKWKQHCHKCPKLKADIPAWFFDKTASMQKEKRQLFDKIKKLTVVGVSEKITEDAKKSYVFSGRNCTCIQNAVDDTIFYEGENDYFDRCDVCRIIGSASEWSEYKGIEDFALLGRLCKDRFGDQVRISLAGSLDKLSTDTKKRLNDAGIDFLGSLSSTDLADEYRASDIFVSLSKGESYGLSISEAMACGLPVISREGYAEGDMVREYCRGYVVGNNEKCEKIVKYIDEIYFSADAEHTKSSVTENKEPQSIAKYVDLFLTIYERF